MTKLSLLFLLMIFVCTSVFGQDSLKRQFNNYLLQKEERRKADSARKAQRQIQEQQEKQTQVAIEQQKTDSLKKEIKKLIDNPVVKPQPEKPAENIVVTPDGKKFIIAQGGQLEPILLQEIDTVDYINRAIQVRRYDALGSRSDDYWDKLRKLRHDSVYKEKHQLIPKVKIFGWHPYWMGNAFKSYNFSLLSHIAYFSYELNPQTGSYKNIHNWRTTSLIDSAKKYQNKVLLSVTNFGPAANAQFLANRQAQKVFTDSIKTLLQARNADGINLDFEYVPKKSKDEFTNFVIALATELRQSKADYQITLAVPAIDFDSVYDIKQLDAHIDLYVIMGYEFYGRGSQHAGPVAPVQSGGVWWEYNLEKSLDYYLKSGIAPQKLLMGLPYYGSEWETEDLKVPSKSKRFVSYRTYRQIREQHGKISCCDEPVSMSRFYGYRDGISEYRQIWFEDEFSLAKKYDWVLGKKIGGVGIWALGYDNGYTELWRLLALKFGESPKKTESVASKIFDSIRRRPPSFVARILYLVQNPLQLLNRTGVFPSILSMLFLSNLLAYFGLQRYACHWGALPTLLVRIFIVFGLLSGLALILHKYNIAHLRDTFIFLVGVFLATAIFLLFSKNFFAEKDLP